MAIPNARADTTTEQFFEGTITEFYNGGYVPEKVGRHGCVLDLWRD
jgi:hypothetical protein